MQGWWLGIFWRRASQERVFPFPDPAFPSPDLASYARSLSSLARLQFVRRIVCGRAPDVPFQGAWSHQLGILYTRLHLATLDADGAVRPSQSNLQIANKCDALSDVDRRRLS